MPTNDQTKGQLKSRSIRQDHSALSSNPELPAFIARPVGSPVYHGFELVPESAKDGWIYGAITDFDDLEPATEGNGFVIAPDGTRAGIAWATDTGEFYEVLAPDENRWGVYGVRFPKPVGNRNDIIECFHFVLPHLQRKYAELKAAGAFER